MESIDQQKDAMRKMIFTRRRAMTDQQRTTQSLQACRKLVALLDLSPHSVLGLYSAMDQELSLHALAHHAYQCGTAVAFPCMRKPGAPGEPMLMDFRLVAPEHYQQETAPFVTNPLKSFKANDPALEAFPLVDPADLTHLVCPLVAFDAHRNRLGYGGGNYDRYLPQLSPRCKIMGVAFAQQEVELVPTDVHDIRIPIVSA